MSAITPPLPTPGRRADRDDRRVRQALGRERPRRRARQPADHPRPARHLRRLPGPERPLPDGRQLRQPHGPGRGRSRSSRWASSSSCCSARSTSRSATSRASRGVLTALLLLPDGSTVPTAVAIAAALGSGVVDRHAARADHHEDRHPVVRRDARRPAGLERRRAAADRQPRHGRAAGRLRHRLRQRLRRPRARPGCSCCSPSAPTRPSSCGACASARAAGLSNDPLLIVALRIAGLFVALAFVV